VPQRLIGVPTAVALLVVAAGCKPQLPSAPPNDIAIRIEWSGPADLDLYVKEPGGTEISRHTTQSPTGAIYSGDCNATPQTMCASPMEMVYWPKRNAPAGAFHYRVLLVNNHLQAMPVAFKVFVLHDTKIVNEEEASISNVRGWWGPRTVTRK
jgi:hypothetical protein